MGSFFENPWGLLFSDIEIILNYLNRVSAVTQSLTAQINYTYDALGNVTGITQGEKEVKTTYDAVGNTISVTDPLGSVRSYTYDKDSRMTSSTDFAGNISSVQYDAAGNILKLTDALGFEQIFAYNSDGNVTQTTDAAGNTTEYRYDLAGQLIAVKSALGNVTEYTYDSMGNMTAKKAADGSETLYGYDLHNNLISLTSPDDTVETFVYDISSRIDKAIKPDGSVIEYDYDKLNNLISKSYSDGTESVTYGYDAAGNRVTMDDEEGQTAYTYDVLGRVTSVTDAGGHTVSYEYDEYGRTSAIIYPENRVVSYTYDLADRLLTVDDSNSGKTEYTYNANGDVLTCTRQDGIKTTYSYDALGQVTEVINTKGDSELSSFAYTYDENGRIATEYAKQDGNISEKQFTYDAEGQIKSYTETINGETSVTTYGYSVIGNRVAVTKGEDKDTVVYEYDESGKLIKEISGDEGTAEYSYDENGNIVQKETDEQTLTYSYDIENRLTAVREGGALLMAATYDGDGNRTFQLTREKVEFKIEREEAGENAENPYAEDTDTVDSVGDMPKTESGTRNPENDASKLDDTSSTVQAQVNTYYEKEYVDPADTIFWYGFGQGIMNLFGNINTALSSYLSDWFCHEWDFITDEYELVLHSEATYSEEDIEAMRRAGLSEEEIADITGAEVDKNGNVMVEFTDTTASKGNELDSNTTDSDEQPVSGESVIIPAVPDQATRIDYDLTYYVNDINTANEQVLMTYGRNESQKAVYTYGAERIAEDDLQTDE